MKAQKLLIAYGILFLVTGCGKDDTEPMIEVDPRVRELSCNWDSEYRIDSEIKNVSGIIEQVIAAEPFWVINVTNQGMPAVRTGKARACNLPDSAKIAGLKVKISGLVLSTALQRDPMVSLLADDFELSNFAIIE